MFRFIFYTIVVGIILTGLILIAGTGVYNVPYVTKFLKTDKPLNLGIAKDRVYFEDLKNRAKINLINDLNEYCFDCNIIYKSPQAMNLTITSEEITSSLASIDGSFTYPLTDIQVRLGSDNQAEVSAYVDLTKYGYELKGPVYFEVEVSTDDNQLAFDLNKAKFGVLPVPQKYFPQIEKEFNNLINSRLKKVNGLTIKEFNIEDGNIYYRGNFPTVISVAKN